MKITDKIQEVGLRNTIIGTCKLYKYRRLQSKYGFYEWNISPFELRKYIQSVASYINKCSPECVIDIGCGLGELLRNVKAKKRIGIDMGEQDIRVARLLDKTGTIQFKQGVFGGVVISREKADFLVTLGFTHGKNEDYWKPIYGQFLNNNDVAKVIVDVFPETEKQYSLNFSNILPDAYEMIDEMGPYNGDKKIQIYGKERD